MKNWQAAWVGVAVMTSAIAGAQQAQPEDVASVHKAFKADVSGVAPLYFLTEDGYVESMAAPPGGRFDLGDQAKSADPAAAAKAFVDVHRAALGVKSDRADFVIGDVSESNGSRSVQLHQTYNGVPVFGGVVNVSIIGPADIGGLISDVMRNANRLDRESTATVPSKSAEEAGEAAAAVVQTATNTASLSRLPSELLIYDPAIIDQPGAPHLAYRTVVQSPNGAAVSEVVLTDAHTNDVLLRYSMICSAKSRVIYDLAIFSPGGLGTQVRAEGESAVPESPDVNAAYDFLGDSYDFFLQNHGRDSFDNLGGQIRAYVHDAPGNAYYYNHPQLGPLTAYGRGLAVDDVVAHEYTHAVTDFTSKLIYINESGAINESLSDIWGEAIDLVNGSADDTFINRWELGEGSAVGAIRSLKNPENYGQPDRYSRIQRMPLFLDNGGVHVNSGIGNKLFQLLVDGGVFNDFAISPMNMYDVLDIYYRAQTSYLTPGSNYASLFSALFLSANDLGWTDAELSNLVEAGSAVEIVGSAPGLPLRDLRAQSLPNSNSVIVTWKNPATSAFSGAYIVKNTNRFPESNSDGTIINVGLASNYLDTALAPGQHAYYKVVAELQNAALPYKPQFLFVHEESRAPANIDYLSEEFPQGSDLSFKQLLYAPVGDWTEIYDSNRPPDYTNHRFYSLSVTHNVSALPVLRQNAASIPLSEDVPTVLTESILGGPIPFYGRIASSLILSPNGFVAPAEPAVTTALANSFQFNFPSYANHWAVPRLSAVFADLSPPSGGTIWSRRLSDKFVITFEDVPQYNVFPPRNSTFQIELYYSGHIRVTYLDVAAEGSVAGLSDGRGIPQEPTQLPNPLATVLITDLSSAQTTPAFNIRPIAIQTVDEGGVAAFIVNTDGAPNGPVVITAESLPLGATFNPVTREFFWATGKGDRGSYSIGFKAVSGLSVAHQNAFVVVRPVGDNPSVISLDIVPEQPEVGQPLELIYEYSEPNGIAEGSSDIYWYRNNAFVNGLTNQRGVPGVALVAGDQWAVAVVPRSALGVAGPVVWSETFAIAPASKADINGDKTVDAVDIQLVINAVLGKAVGVLDADANLDGEINAADVQTVVNKALK